jgi:hypothetical protein
MFPRAELPIAASRAIRLDARSIGQILRPAISPAPESLNQTEFSTDGIMNDAMNGQASSTRKARTYHGACFCGAVTLTVTGEPAGMGYCHCESCRSWSAAPVNAFTLWKPESVRVTQGAEQIGTFNKTSQSYRKWCITCGGHLFTEHPGMGLIDVYAAVIPDFPYQAGVHVNYLETTLRIQDGLPKVRDVPQGMGGSGVLIAE